MCNEQRKHAALLLQMVPGVKSIHAACLKRVLLFAYVRTACSGARQCRAQVAGACSHAREEGDDHAGSRAGRPQRRGSAFTPW